MGLPKPADFPNAAQGGRKAQIKGEEGVNNLSK